MAKGLGRGLDAILALNSVGGEPAKTIGEMVAVERIIPNPTQPRTVFDQTALDELADSIRAVGIIQPITVKPEGDKYIIISGERRWRAACAAGLETVPVFVREVTDQNLHEMALVENIQRQDLNAMEVALSLKRLMEECGLTQDKLSERVGKKRSTVANYLRLLNLPAEVQLAVREELISMGHAKVIASADEMRQLPLLKKCLKKNLSVRQLEDYAAKLANARSAASVDEEEYPESYGRLVELLERYFSENISIKTTKSGKGKIVIEFAGEQDVERFINKLGGK